MNYKTWNNEYQRLLEVIQGKVTFIQNRQNNLSPIDRPKDKAIFDRLETEKKFINDLVAFLYQTENAIKDMDNKNKLLNINYRTLKFLHESNLIELESNYERDIKNVIGITNKE